MLWCFWFSIVNWQRDKKNFYLKKKVNNEALLQYSALIETQFKFNDDSVLQVFIKM